MVAKTTFRIGQIVPSSNTTMETEIPAILRAREGVLPERFTFHSSRMRMKKVTKEELAAMDADSDRCAAELSDARVDVLGYACLVAIMSMGKGYHCQSEKRLEEVTAREGGAAPLVARARGPVHDPLALIDIYKRLKLDGIDVLVLSSCVQMPSLAAIPIVERECGLPVISAAVCTAYQMLQKLGLKTYAPDAGALLSGRY